MQLEDTRDDVHDMDLKNKGFEAGGGTCNSLATGTPLASPKLTSTE